MGSQVERSPLHLHVGGKSKLLIPSADEVRGRDSYPDQTSIFIAKPAAKPADSFVTKVSNAEGVG